MTIVLYTGGTGMTKKEKQQEVEKAIDILARWLTESRTKKEALSKRARVSELEHRIGNGINITDGKQEVRVELRLRIEEL